MRAATALLVPVSASCVGPDVSLGMPLTGDSDAFTSGPTGGVEEAGTESPTQGASGDETGDAGTDPPQTGDCGLAEPAFCETFETVHPGGRGGDLDETQWSFARWAHLVQYFWLRIPASTYPDHLYPATFCGEPFAGILPGDDVRACDGVGVDGTISRQLNEVFDDQGSIALHSMRIRQPFDFADRTGTIVWDVDAKVNPHNVGHGWWIELWITEDPAPLPHDELAAVSSLPRRGVGFAFRFGADCPNDADSWGSALETVFVTDAHEIVAYRQDFVATDPAGPCFRTMDGRLNHFELQISRQRAELAVTDYDDPLGPPVVVAVEGLDLPFSRGYLHLQHGQFNAAQDGLDGCENGEPSTCPTPSQTYRWDNIGFDGPILPTPRGYDAPDPADPGPDGGVYFGWALGEGVSHTLTFSDVDPEGAVAASLSFNVFASQGQVLEYRFNAGAWEQFVVPGPMPDALVRGYTVDVDIAALVAGANDLEVRMLDPVHVVESIGNVDLTLELPE